MGHTFPARPWGFLFTLSFRDLAYFCTNKSPFHFFSEFFFKFKSVWFLTQVLQNRGSTQSLASKPYIFRFQIIVTFTFNKQLNIGKIGISGQAFLKWVIAQSGTMETVKYLRLFPRVLRALHKLMVIPYWWKQDSCITLNAENLNWLTGVLMPTDYCSW